MSAPFLGEIRIVAFNFAPRGWAYCDGQLLPISQYQALFSLLGTIYGGDGRVTFALPDMRGRAPVHFGSGPGLSNRNIGQKYGATTDTLTVAEMPAHTHPMHASDADGDEFGPINNYYSQEDFGGTLQPIYSTQGTVSMNPGMIQNTGNSQPHDNMQPYLTVGFCIALQGIFPPRN